TSSRRHTRFSRDWSSDVCSSDLLEILVGRHRLNFVQHRLLATRLNNASLVGRDGAECATTKTAPHDRDRVLDHVVGWNRLAVTGDRKSVVEGKEVDLGWPSLIAC